MEKMIQLGCEGEGEGVRFVLVMICLCLLPPPPSLYPPTHSLRNKIVNSHHSTPSRYPATRKP